MDFVHVLVLLFFEVFLPFDVEFLEGFLADFDVVFELALLDIRPKFVLVCHNFRLKQPNLPHQILIQLIFEDFAALVCQ